MSAYNDRIRRELGFGMIHWKTPERGAPASNASTLRTSGTDPVPSTACTGTGSAAPGTFCTAPDKQ